MSRLAGVCAVAALWPGVLAASSLASLETYGNLHTGGAVAAVTGDTNGNATVSLDWRPAGEAFRPGHPLLRIDATRFVGSVFDLQPGSAYEVRVTLADPDGVTGAPTLTQALATRAEAFAEPTLRTLYVAPNGSDGNPGTMALPLLTIQEAANRAQAGDLVLIQPGVYRESVSVPRSGTAAQPIVFRGNGPGAILDGADGAIAAGVAWTATGAGVHTRVTGFATGHVVTELGRLFRYDSLAALQALAAGAPGGFHFDGTTLHVKFANGSAPAAHTMHVARREDGFLIDGRTFVRVENLEIRHFGAGDFGKGVYLRYASDCAVRLSRLHEIGAAGVWIKGGARNRVEDNEMWDTSIFGWPWDETKGSSAENNAVTFTDDVGRGNVVRRNQVRGFFNGMGPCGSAAPPAGVTSETDVYDNDFREHTDDALEPEGYCANVRLFRNRIRDVHMAFATAPAAPGPLWIVRNVAWRFGNTRTSQQDGYTASALKVNSGFATPIGPVLLYHNTLLTDTPGTDAIALLNPGTGTLLRARNNLIAGTRYALYKVNPIPWDGNGDDLFTTDSTRLVSWLGTRYDTLAAYRGALGQELQGLSAAPLLASPAAGDFTPATGSPLIDRGLVIAGINDGFNGSAPDVGAVETLGLPALSIGDVAQPEGTLTPPTTPFVFTVTLSAPSAQPVTVSYATVPGTAAAGSDFTSAAGTLTFAPGDTTGTVPVTVMADDRDEPDEQFTVLLAGPSGATLADAQALGTIVDDDAPPVVSSTGATGVDDVCGATPASFVLRLAPVSGQAVSVQYSLEPGTATAGLDYESVSGTVTFTPGDASVNVSVPVIDDLLREPDETFVLHLSNPVNATVGTPQAPGTIDDRDGAPAGFRGELSHGRVVTDDLRGSEAHRDRFHLLQSPHASYEAVVDGVSGDVDPLRLRRVDCAGATVQESVPVGTGTSRALRWQHPLVVPVASQHILVESGGCAADCGPDDVYRLRFHETTGSIARVNNTASQVTVLVLQNPTSAPLGGHLHFWTSQGVHFPTPPPFTIPAHGSLVVNTAALSGLGGFSGSLTLTHDGPYGALTGKAVALEPATGYSFDTPLVPRPR